MAKCFKCGSTEAEKWRFCSVKGKYVCLRCEMACEHYSHKMLPNGVHCRLKYFPTAAYMVTPERIAERRGVFDKLSTTQLIERITEMQKRYKACEDSEIRQDYRVRLAAATTVLEERQRI